MIAQYIQPLFRPPSEGENLIIQATIGCSFNQCSFCSMYRSKRYYERPLDDLFNEIDQLSAQWPETRRIFLADGDALAMSFDQLSQLLIKLNNAFPSLSRVSCYATPSNLLRKGVDELNRLRDLKLSLLYLGVESGSSTILKKITKGATHQGIAEAINKAEDANIRVSATVILGLGGQTHWQEHIDGTIELLNKAPVTYLSTLQLYLDDTQYDEFMIKFGEPFQMQDDHAILLEQQRLIAGLNPNKPIIFRSNHASNALALAGNLPKHREQLLSMIDDALNGNRRLRPLSHRGM